MRWRRKHNRKPGRAEISRHGGLRVGPGEKCGRPHGDGRVRHRRGGGPGVRADHRPVRLRGSVQADAQSGAGPGDPRGDGEPEQHQPGDRGAAAGAGQAAAGEDRPAGEGEEAQKGLTVFLCLNEIYYLFVDKLLLSVRKQVNKPGPRSFLSDCDLTRGEVPIPHCIVLHYK